MAETRKGKVTLRSGCRSSWPRFDDLISFRYAIQYRLCNFSLSRYETFPVDRSRAAGVRWSVWHTCVKLLCSILITVTPPYSMFIGGRHEDKLFDRALESRNNEFPF